ncbi:hypothetical protein HDV00_009542 [Rhizophlyctis rosea]|nr:hypothetical protein HDV00_009542 [Rhizophlyctis rosea]
MDSGRERASTEVPSIQPPHTPAQNQRPGVTQPDPAYTSNPVVNLHELQGKYSNGTTAAIALNHQIGGLIEGTAHLVNLLQANAAGMAQLQQRSNYVNQALRATNAELQDHRQDLEEHAAAVDGFVKAVKDRELSVKSADARVKKAKQNL